MISLISLSFFWGPCSFNDFTNKKMRDFEPMGALVLNDPISFERIEELSFTSLSDIDKEIISVYLKGGKKKFLKNCSSSFYILGKYNLSDKYAIFGILLDEKGRVMGIDISQDNATIETFDERLTICHGDDNLSQKLISLVNKQVKKLNTD